MENKFSFISLWDVYSGLLTPVQQEITDLYFNKDLTVSEIAQEKGISRQAVSECLKGCKKQLEEYDEKINVVKKLHEASLETSFMLTDALKWAEGFKAEHPEFAEDLNALCDILQRDYAGEVEKTLNNSQMLEVLQKDYTEKVFKTSKTGEE